MRSYVGQTCYEPNNVFETRSWAHSFLGCGSQRSGRTLNVARSELDTTKVSLAHIDTQTYATSSAALCVWKHCHPSSNMVRSRLGLRSCAQISGCNSPPSSVGRAQGP
jgi:hypothetical protein